MHEKDAPYQILFLAYSDICEMLSRMINVNSFPKIKCTSKTNIVPIHNTPVGFTILSIFLSITVKSITKVNRESAAAVEFVCSRYVCQLKG